MPKIIDHDAVQEKICQQLMTGMSMREICQHKDMPHMETVMGWLRTNTAFSVQYAQAREAQAEMMADRMIEIALNPPKNMDPAILRAQMEAIKWAAGKMKPAKYGADQLLRRRADDDYEREIINITPEPDGGDAPRLDKKQLARVIWHTLMNGDEPDEEAK